MDEEKKKQLKYKNYTMLALLILFMSIMFCLTIVKMNKSKIHLSNLIEFKENYFMENML